MTEVKDGIGKLTDSVPASCSRALMASLSQMLQIETSYAKMLNLALVNKIDCSKELYQFSPFFSFFQRLHTFFSHRHSSETIVSTRGG